MSLITAFPEVELFFNNERFTDNELLLFLEKAEQKYKDKDIRKALFSLVELKILQFESFPKEEKKAKNIVARARPLKLRSDNSPKYHSLLLYLRSLTIENIAQSLDLRTNFVLQLMQQKGIIKTSDMILEDSEFKILQEMFNSFLMALERKDKSFHMIKRINNKNKEKSIGKGYDVYSKILANGGTGKLIYIRKI